MRSFDAAQDDICIDKRYARFEIIGQSRGFLYTTKTPSNHQVESVFLFARFWFKKFWIVNDKLHWQPMLFSFVKII